MSANVLGPFALLAHQGGWDEFLLVAVPIVVIIVVLAIAKRRVDAIDRSSDVASDAASDEHPGS